MLLPRVGMLTIDVRPVESTISCSGRVFMSPAITINAQENAVDIASVVSSKCLSKSTVG